MQDHYRTYSPESDKEIEIIDPSLNKHIDHIASTQMILE